MNQKKHTIQEPEHKCKVCKKQIHPRTHKQKLCKQCSIPFWEGYRKGRISTTKEYNKELNHIFELILEE